MKNKINKQQLIKMYTKKSDIRQGYIEVLKTVGLVTIIVSFVLIKFNGKLEIFLLTILTFSFTFFIILLNIISNALENYRNIKCINKIERGDFYIIKDSVKKVSRRLGRNYDDSKPVLRVQFTNKHHFFWADENMVIHEKDEYYIILFKKGNYRGGRKTILINPKIIGFYKCKDYDIDYIYNSNIEQFWENGVLYADYMK